MERKNGEGSKKEKINLLINFSRKNIGRR